MSVYLHMFHGRDLVEQEMDDWGYDGPTLGPFKYAHITYMNEVKFAMELEAYKKEFPEDINPHYYHEDGHNWVEGHFSTPDGCLAHKGKFYGDFSIFTKDIAEKDGLL